MHTYKHIYIILFVSFLTLQGCKSLKSKQNKNTQTPQVQQLTKDESKFTYYFIEGLKERMKGNLELAENLYKECLKLDPTSLPVKYELGYLNRYKGLNDIAFKFAKDCALQDPKNQWYQLFYIECLEDKKQYTQAADIYQKLIKAHPNKPEFHEGLATQYLYADQYDKALKVYDDLEQKFGQNETFTINKIKLLKQLNKNNEVESELKKLIKNNPTEARYYTYLAEYYQETKQDEKALNTYKEILNFEPNNPMVHLAYADYYKNKNDKENFFKEMKIAFESPDLDVDTKLKILISFYKLSEESADILAQAYELIDITLRVHPNEPESHSIYADFLLRDKKLKQARDEYETAAKYEKNKFAVWSQLMFVDSELNDYQSLAVHSAEAIDLFPNQPIPYFFNGIANIQLKKYEIAIEALKDGAEFVYNNNALLIQFFSNLGDAYNSIKDFDNSDKSFDNALKVDPDNTFVLNNYAYYLSLRKTKLEKAEKFSKRCNELAPNNRNYIDTYGWILYQLGKYKESEIWLLRASKMGNKSTVILEHYGDVLYKLNKVDEALNTWKEAKEAGKGSEWLDKKIAEVKMYE